MYNFKGFSEKANIALNLAFECAQNMGHTFVGSEHILLGLLKTDSCAAQTILNDNGLDAEAVNDKLLEIHGQGIRCSLNPNDITARGKRTLQAAKSISNRMGHGYVGTEHILLALIQDSESYAVRFIQELGGDIIQLLFAGVAAARLRGVVRPAQQRVEQLQAGAVGQRLARMIPYR